MKILQIIPSISLVYGGPSQMVRGLSAALAKLGVDVTVLTTNVNGDSGQAPLDVPLDQPVNENGYQVRYFPCSPFRRYKFSLDLLTWLKTHASEYDLAHIHALFSPVSSAAATVARSQKLPYILRPLGTLDPADLNKKKQLKKLYAALLERPNIAGASAIHFTSHEEARISERFGVKTNDLIIPLGVTLPELTKTPEAILSHLKIKPNVPIILFLSRIEPKKGLDILIPALEKVLATGLDFQFILAGSNPQDPEYETKIKQQIQSSPLAEKTIISGFVTGETKTALLTIADLFVLPSYYENFGIAVAEAMAVGTPVIISKGIYIWEDVEAAEAGWVGNGTIDEISSLIETALTNSQERQSRGLNAQNYALTYYSWDAIAQQMIQAYQGLIH
ncbi:hormogonium polysaccharide biosynthesis glycosyltransferase HpsP [Planktothrix sp. FACHB-1365]|uniref:hormogonium polysaccharide biosynthesis glycosyltransferase HpsP n=1 Tax=Planktothrix sp. FACHB-1365 TaxID=2692855 RepID=UPI001687EF4A|nr:hormogonium polysaccharide biosynthesis glycosyltransferase HpsP [Planktothrix sp. FACHB-1365]MBD2480685.1 glycosyltransferase [Planktothrix sp. FACHB-1365]